MIAKFENRKLSENIYTSAHKYVNLQNLPHWHMEYELVFCDSGSAKVTVNSDQYILKKGHCLFIGSGEVHNIHSLSDSIISVIKIDRKLVDTAFEGKTPAYPLIKTDLPLNEIFDELASENREKQSFCTVICDCLILKTLAQLFRSCSMSHRQKAGGSEKYKSLLMLIEKRYTDITFEEAAEFMCYSNPYFSRYFAGITGMSFSSYLNIIRVAEAVSMISQKNLLLPK